MGGCPATIGIDGMAVRCQLTDEHESEKHRAAWRDLVGGWHELEWTGLDAWLRATRQAPAV